MINPDLVIENHLEDNISATGSFDFLNQTKAGKKFDNINVVVR